MRISLLDVLPKGLMVQLSVNSARLLSEMAQLSQFIRYDALSDSYSIHQIFGEFLLEHNSLSGEQRTEVHALAAALYRDNSFMLEAIDHYRKCNSYNEIFDIIRTANRRVGQEVADFFIKLIEEAPAELVRARPIFYVVKAYCLVNNNRIDAAYKELKWLQQTYEGLPAKTENLALLGETYILLALISIINQNFEFEELFKLADRCLPDGSILVDYRLNIAEGNQHHRN